MVIRIKAGKDVVVHYTDIDIDIDIYIYVLWRVCDK